MASGELPDAVHFPRFEPDANRVRLAVGEALPDRLKPGATLVVDLPGFSPGRYAVGVATMGGTPIGPLGGISRRPYHETRKLEVRWNDQQIWSRWVNPVHAVNRAMVPPHAVEKHGNVITLFNPGTEALALDAVWLEPLQRGEHPFYVAAEDAEGLNRQDAAWIRNVTLRLPLTHSAFDPKEFPVHSAQNPPQSPAELEAAWRISTEKLQVLHSAAHPVARELEVWHQRLGQAVARGMMPGIVVEAPRGPNPEACLHAAVYIYGSLIHSWVLPRNPAGYRAAKTLSANHPRAEVVFNYHPMETEWPTFKRRIPWHYKSHLMADVANRRAYFDGELDAAGFVYTRNFLLGLRSNFHGYIWREQPYQSGTVHAALAEHLMTYDRGATLHDTFPGGPMFPAGDDTPGLMWYYLRSVFRFGGPGYRKSLANLTGEGPQPEIGMAFWAVADNDVDSVQVLVHTPRLVSGRSGRLSLPVPWSGPTELLLHPVVFTPRDGPFPKTDMVRRTLVARPFLDETTNREGGWVEFTFPLHVHHLMELRPAGRASPRHNFAPERIGFDSLQEVDTLFDVSTSAPPPWWSRERLAMNTFTRWRVSGNVDLSHDGPATRQGTPDWDGLQGFHLPMQTTLDTVSPLDATSTRFRFLKPEERVAQVVRAQWPMHHLRRGEQLGIWLRANPAPDYLPSHPWAIGPQRTRFYMGTLPYRQLIEIEYNRWYFISSHVDAWHHRTSGHDRHLIFWPANPLDGEPEIEVNTIDLYQVRQKPSSPKPGRSLGFIQTDHSGNMQVLVLGVPGQATSWRQRLPYLVQADTFRHVIDPALLTTAETPEEDPPEVVRYRLRILEEARLLEVGIDKMPEIPSEVHLRKIQRHFPLIAPALRNHAVGALLLDTTPLENSLENR